MQTVMKTIRKQNAKDSVRNKQRKIKILAMSANSKLVNQQTYASSFAKAVAIQSKDGYLLFCCT
jgi:hypothetical protein